ncbi:MAG: hypothetical protein ACLP9K_05420 [Nitrososphaerales archaeon]
MNNLLAERLLAEVMDWKAEDLANERPLLQDMANYRYDDYQQYYAGMRFIESLAVWLAQFESLNERRIAYNFVKTRLIYISSTEMLHLISTSFGTFVKPPLLQKIANDRRIPVWRVLRIASSVEFRVLLRQSIFLGLSDGARIDSFRRSNPMISHEQVRAYEVSPRRANEMLKELRGDLQVLLGREPSQEETRFRNAFLLDDFSASGLSYLRHEEHEEELKGKIAIFFRSITPPNGEMHQLFERKDLSVYVLLYVATQHACEYLQEQLRRHYSDVPSFVGAVHVLRESAKISETRDKEFIDLLRKYYDKSIETPAYLKGKHDYPYLGFDECALPVILSHNTPNNTVPLLWFEEGSKYRGLFPRVSRFKGAV